MSERFICLFVDDDPGVRELVALNLQAEGVEVHLSETGFGIEEFVQVLRPDVIMLDVMMAGRDGYEVLRGLKSNETTRNIPVILLTAKATDAEIWDGWKAGADYYLTKPFNIDQLVEYLGLILAERAVRL
jgi:two-component system phosphate regulon response regulator PhoB